MAEPGAPGPAAARQGGAVASAPAGAPQTRPFPALDAPYDQLQALPRPLWLPTLVASAGQPAARLADAATWLQALAGHGRLPPPEADFGDAAASAPLRAVVGELGLAPLAQGVPALAEQILRTLLWHLDRIVDHQPRLSRTQAIAQVSADFRAAWQEEGTGLEDDLALLQGLGDLARLRWDALRGQLSSRPWAAARQASALLAQLPALAGLIERLGRARRHPAGAPAPQPAPTDGAAPPQPLRALHTRLPDAPGEITGLRWSASPERMLPSEAVMLRHPLLRTLWRARQAEGRLLSWQTEALLTDWRADPLAAPRRRSTPPPPEPLAHGPFILCLDTSGSMRGAPEQIAKAVVIAALRAAHAAGRGCVLMAFGGPDELLERTLDTTPAGLQALLDLMPLGFDGGTDVQTPIERAIDRVHQAGWHSADLLVVSDGEFGCVPATLARLDAARAQLGLRVQGVLVGDRETLGLMALCDDIHWVRDWRRFAADAATARAPSPVHSQSLTALYFPNALPARAARHRPGG